MDPIKNNTRQNGEGLVVTEGGVRSDGNVYTDPAAAAAAAQRKKTLNEQGGQAPAVAVKQQIFG